METFGLVVLILFGISLFYFFRDRDKMLSSSVDSFGGMREKYNIIINELLREPNATISHQERDRIIISMKTSNTYTEFIILEYFTDIEILWNAKLGVLGNHKHKWAYPKTTSQHQILEDIRNFMNNKLTSIY